VPDATFFAAPAAWRAWLAEHHATHTELLVGFWKVGSGQPCMTWSESVDQALCYGWIDGVTRRLDDQSYAIRFTRRKPGSTWSNVNIAKVDALQAAGLMQPAGTAAFEARTPARTGIYSFEQDDVALAPADDRLLRADADAWSFFSAQAPSYQRAATWWVRSAKRVDTQQRRLAALISDSAAGRRLKHLSR